MSFGRPPGSVGKILVNPPERGSFPLDHDGECKPAMMTYLKCLGAHRNNSDACRALIKVYLECRMSNGLMERDDWENLGLGEAVPSLSSPQDPADSSSSVTSDSKSSARFSKSI